MFKNFDFIENADLKNWSTVKIGGEAKYFVFPKNHLELLEILKIAKENNLKTFILGNGSNVLFEDKGFDGAIINLKHFNKVKVVGENEVFVGAGINLFVLNQKLKNLGMSGLEWSYGIPATLGGLIVMNGGCFGHEICEFVKSVLVIEGSKLKVLKVEEIEFSYRYSSLKDWCIVLGAVLQLQKKDSLVIEQDMKIFLEKKRSTQPCEFPSLGSVFKQIRKNDEIIYPAKLIDNMGMKGVKIGGAEISQKHAGFIVNKGGATSADYLALVELIEQKLAAVGVNLKREIVILR